MSFNPQLVTGSAPTWKAQPDDYILRWTSGAITLPDVGYRLVRVLTEAGTTPGSFSVSYDGVSHAHFPSPSNGTNGAASWAVLWAFKGTTLPASLFALNGGASAATLTFSKGQTNAPDIASYRAIRFTVTTSATHSTPTAFAAPVAYDVAPAVPSAMMAVATTVGYQAQWPAIGTAQSGAPADSQPSQLAVHAAPKLPKALTLSMSYTNTVAAGTMDLYVGYEPQ